MTQPGYLRFPHLRGDAPVFVAEDDVRTAPLTGGRAHRLTADAARAANPRISPDGIRAAWTSWRDGGSDTLVAGIDGGRARRLTYWGDARTVGWTAAGEVLAVSAAGRYAMGRTWAYAVGGVIGIDSRYELVDGTGVTQPRYNHWFDGVGWGMENHGVDPDVEVVITPQDWVAGRDPPLERAVDLAMAALVTNPPVQPPDPATRSSRRRPDLPPRSARRVG